MSTDKQLQRKIMNNIYPHKIPGENKEIHYEKESKHCNMCI